MFEEEEEDGLATALGCNALETRGAVSALPSLAVDEGEEIDRLANIEAQAPAPIQRNGNRGSRKRSLTKKRTTPRE